MTTFMKERRQVLDQLLNHYGRQYWWEDENPIGDWVSMILIQQTTEKNAKKALEQLKDYLTVEQLLALSEEELQELIRPAGFYKQKSSYIKSLMTWFANHGGQLDKFTDYSTADLRKELLTIKGVGPETADAMLLYIFKRNVFIADQYAMRLFNRLGLGDYKTYRELQADFKEIVNQVPNEVCREWHAVIDVHGKHFGKDKTMDESWLLGPIK